MFNAFFTNQLPHYVNLIGGGGGADTFETMYETFQELTNIQLSHFIENFSGSTLNAIWNTDTSGVGAVIEDAIDGGLKISTGTTAFNDSDIDFNQKHNYSPTASIMISISKMYSTADIIWETGLQHADSFCRFIFDSSVDTFYQASSYDDVTASATATDVTPDTSWHNFEVVLGSDDLDYYIDGVLKVTKTTNRPIVAMQPFHRVTTRTAAAKAMGLRYNEYYNTTVTILSSLYERLSALTQVMSQRMVETFSGAIINAIWTKQTVVGTPVFEMSDEIDGGYKITCATTSNELGSLTFNDKRQFDFENAVSIGVTKCDLTDNAMVSSGLIGNKVNTNIENARGGMDKNFSTSFYVCESADATVSSGTDSDVALDTIYHVHKVDLSSDDIDYYIDGVLKVTKTTNRPTVKLQPAFNCQRQGADMVGQILYLEAYNKLTTETDYASVYELFNLLSVVARQHFWEWFNGKILSNRWVEGSSSGGGTFQMSDSEDGGFEMVHVNQVWSEMNIGFGTYAGTGKRFFDQDNANFIAVTKMGRSTDIMETLGLWNDNNDHKNSVVMWTQTSDNAFINLKSGDATVNSFTASDVANSTNWKEIQIIINGTDMDLYIDGVLKVSKTTNYPVDKLEPIWQNMTRSSTGFTANIRFMEVKNVIA